MKLRDRAAGNSIVWIAVVGLLLLAHGDSINLVRAVSFVTVAKSIWSVLCAESGVVLAPENVIVENRASNPQLSFPIVNLNPLELGKDHRHRISLDFVPPYGAFTYTDDGRIEISSALHGHDELRGIKANMEGGSLPYVGKDHFESIGFSGVPLVRVVDYVHRINDEIRALFQSEIQRTGLQRGIGGRCRTAGGVGGALSRKTLPRSQSRIDENQNRGNDGPSKLFLAVGGVVFLIGAVLLSKILNQVYLNPRFNVNMAVCGFFLGGGFIVLGGGIVFWVLGLLS